MSCGSPAFALFAPQDRKIAKPRKFHANLPTCLPGRAAAAARGGHKLLETRVESSVILTPFERNHGTASFSILRFIVLHSSFSRSFL